MIHSMFFFKLGWFNHQLDLDRSLWVSLVWLFISAIARQKRPLFVYSAFLVSVFLSFHPDLGRWLMIFQMGRKHKLVKLAVIYPKNLLGRTWRQVILWLNRLCIESVQVEYIYIFTLYLYLYVCTYIVSYICTVFRFFTYRSYSLSLYMANRCIQIKLICLLPHLCSTQHPSNMTCWPLSAQDAIQAKSFKEKVLKIEVLGLFSFHKVGPKTIYK